MQSTKTIRNLQKRYGIPDTTILELLMQKADRAYLNVNSEDGICLFVFDNVM